MHWHPVALICSLFLTDINECVTDRHTCQRREHCVNTMGSFRCLQELSCQPGHELKDGECVGKESVLQLLHRGKELQSILVLLPCDISIAAIKGSSPGKCWALHATPGTFAYLKCFPRITINYLEHG